MCANCHICIFRRLPFLMLAIGPDSISHLSLEVWILQLISCSQACCEYAQVFWQIELVDTFSLI